jgi:phospholipid transport system substrate-binding protein
MMMVTRRLLLQSSAAIAFSLALTRLVPPAHADTLDEATDFITRTAKEITDTVNGSAPLAARRQKLEEIINRVVDVAGVARFCLGRYWRTSTPEQQKEYVGLFHRVLVINITGKIGDYSGVGIAVGKGAEREGDIAVSSVVTRPGNSPNKVEWLVSNATGSMKIIDVIAEGTSLRLTQRSDYSSYLARNNNNVQALIDAMRQQATAASSG